MCDFKILQVKSLFYVMHLRKAEISPFAIFLYDSHASILFLDHKPHKHVLRPEDSVGMPNAGNNVRSLEWDPLSVEYLLVTSAQCTILLVDSVSASVLMCFEQPNATADVHTLAWIYAAPGMFVTGG